MAEEEILRTTNKVQQMNTFYVGDGDEPEWPKKKF